MTVADPLASNLVGAARGDVRPVGAAGGALAGAFALASAGSAAAYVHPAALAAGAGNTLFAAGTVERQLPSGVPTGDLTFGAGQATEVTLSATTAEAWLSRKAVPTYCCLAHHRAGPCAVDPHAGQGLGGGRAGRRLGGGGRELRRPDRLRTGPDRNETTLRPDGFVSAFLATFDVTGRLQWVRRVGGTGTAAPTTLAPLPGGGCLVAGRFDHRPPSSAGRAEPTTLTNTALADHAFLARFGADGSLTWARSLTDGPGQLSDESRVPWPPRRTALRWSPGVSTAQPPSAAGALHP